METESLWQRLVATVLAAPCLGCGELLPGRAVPMALCRLCRGRLAPSPLEACPGCGRALTGGAEASGRVRCGACSGVDLGFDQLRAGWKYQTPIDRVMRALKFRGMDFLAPPMARELAHRVGDLAVGADLVVPVPLHWWRRWRRGYNQAERIARPLARALGLPICNALRRRRLTLRQARLRRRERLVNLDAAFRCPRPERVAGRRILLVDDVVTTGSTLRAAAGALRRAGAAWIGAVAVARTPLPEERVPDEVVEAYGSSPGRDARRRAVAQRGRAGGRDGEPSRLWLWFS